jgi:hypothetical protein
MKFISYLLGKTFDLVYGKIYESETECKYKLGVFAYPAILGDQRFLDFNEYFFYKADYFSVSTV